MWILTLKYIISNIKLPKDSYKKYYSVYTFIIEIDQNDNFNDVLKTWIRYA